MSGMDDFKKQLEELKRKGADIDPDAIIDEITSPPEVQIIEAFENSFDKHAFDLMKQKVMSLLDDFGSFYGPKGRNLSVAVHVQKDNSADRFSENFEYTDGLSIVHIVDIGTKGKYEPIVIGTDEAAVEKEKQRIKKEQRK